MRGGAACQGDRRFPARLRKEVELMNVDPRVFLSQRPKNPLRAAARGGCTEGEGPPVPVPMPLPGLNAASQDGEL